MKPGTRGFFLVLFILGAAAGLGWYLFLRPLQPLDINKVGGTILVYETQDDSPKGLEELVVAVRSRIEGIGAAFPIVKAVPPRRIELAIPREPGHEGHVEEIKELLAMVGHLEFRILANWHDDRFALETADGFFESAAREWDEIRKAVQDRFLPGNLEPLKDVAFDDVDGLVTRLRERKPQLSAMEVRQFIETSCRPGKQLLALRGAAAAGRPPPPPTPKPGNHFIILNEGHRGASYTWMPLSSSEIDTLSTGRENKWDATIADSIQTGKPFRRFKNAGEDSSPLILGQFDWETIFWARKKQSVQKGSTPYECFVLARVPEKDKEVTGTHLERVRDDLDGQGNLAVGLTFNRKGGGLFYELTSQNTADPGGGRRFLAVILDGVVMAAPGVETAIRDSAIIHGRFTHTQVMNMVRILRAGALPLALKPMPVLEIPVEPGNAP